MLINKLIEKGSSLTSAEGVFNIQNVADYYLQTDLPNDGKLNFARDVFSFNPPFKQTWMEFKVPKAIFANNKLILSPLYAALGHAGCLLRRESVPENIVGPDYYAISFSYYTLKNPHSIIGPVTFIGIILCDKNGKYITE